MSKSHTIAFGDRVRIRETPVTIAAGVAKLEGDVFGITTPSVTEVAVIGSNEDDYALNVSFEEKKGEFWFSEDQLEFLDHPPGAEITLDGIDKKWVRARSGEWIEQSTGPKKPWWRFWA